MFKSSDGRILADLDHEGSMFVAARGGSGGKGNRYFATDVNQAPEVAEYGADGEHITYTIEMRTIAHIGLVSIVIINLFQIWMNNIYANIRIGGISECWQIVVPASDLTRPAKSCSLSVYHSSTTRRNGQIRGS